MKASFPKLSLILGGASSGKSAYAENLITQTGIPRSYIATSQPFDDEMRAKIAAHRQSRGEDWDTIEEPHDLARAISMVEAGNAILIDCLTLWISNHLIADTEWDTNATLTAMDAHSSPVICVSNITGLGVIPDNPLGRQFQAAQGKLNQILAKRADLVVNVTAGLPTVLKGYEP